MQIDDFIKDMPGKLVKIPEPHPQGHWAFVPSPLLKRFDLNPQTTKLLSSACLELGTLEGVGRRLPNPHLLIEPFLRREALLSSQMEGTIATAEQLLLFEVAATKPETSDVIEVYNYIKAMEYGLKRLKDLPICLRLIKELHQQLMTGGVRGGKSRPGEFRKTQNAIGKEGQTIDQARFVPPPVSDMMLALDEFENFLNKPNDLASLVELAFIHYQFEAIHPFCDGNGRIGRLLIPLIMCQKGILSKPLLYLSPYFERRRRSYNDHLLGISQRAAWNEWIIFFLQAVIDQSQDAIKRSDKLLAMQKNYHEKFHSPKSSALVLKLIDGLFLNPIITVPEAKRKLKVTYRSAQINIDKLVKKGILHEVTGKQRNRAYVAREILRIIETPNV